MQGWWRRKTRMATPMGVGRGPTMESRTSATTRWRDRGKAGECFSVPILKKVVN